MENLTQILQDATAAIQPNYFLLPVHGTLPVHRERVYCYELYHQMRRRWPEPCDWFLNGEIDKQAHPYFQGVSRPKPDFLVHIPGHDNNFAAIEVKSVRGTNAGIRKDLRTLQRFRAVGYQRAIYLMYGVSPGLFMERVAGSGAEPELLAGIEFWVHEQRGAAAARVEGRGQ